MSDINGESKQPLGAIDNFPITVAGIVIPADVDVTEARTYSVVIGMDWLNKIKAKLDLHSSNMTFEWQGKKGQVKIKYIYGQGYDSPAEFSDESEDSDDESSDSEEEFEIEEQQLENRNFLMAQREDDWTTVQPRKKQVTWNDESSIHIIMEETWTPVETHRRELSEVDFGNVPLPMIRSVEQICEVQCYQEGIRVRAKKYTWSEIEDLDYKIRDSYERHRRYPYNWRGPYKRCWCEKKLYTWNDTCQICYQHLANWVAIYRHKPYRATYKTSQDWAEEVEQEIFVTQ
jgi:hypothetical protein